MRDATGKVKPAKRRRADILRRLGHELEYFALRAALLAMRALPVETSAGCMAFAWRQLGPLSMRHRRAMANLALAFPELDEAARRAIAVRQWDNLGRTFAEALQLDRIVADPARIEFVVSRELAARLAAPGGQVFVSMHSANWELVALPVRRYRHVAGLYQRLTNPRVDALVGGLRAQVFDGGLFAKSARTAGIVTRWVREGNALAVLVDHREGRGIDVTVFGRRTRANPFPAMLARRLGAPLIAGRAMRLPGSRFRIEAVEIPVPVTGDSQADVQKATQAVQEQFEAWIRERPGEWMWTQNRWRGRDAAAAATEGAAAACQGAPNGPISPR